MNTDIRIDVTFPTHRKTVRLRHLVGDRAVEHLLRLWVAAATGAPSGRLERWTLDDVEAAAAWEGKPGQLSEALESCGWLERHEGTLVLHDWTIHQPWVTGAPDRREAAIKAGKASAKKRREKYGSAQPIPNAYRTGCSNDPEPNARTPSPSPSPNKEKPPSSSSTTDPEFNSFWSAFPKKLGKLAAWKAWTKTKRPPLDEILKVLNRQKNSDQWLRDNGQYVPNPATWITGRRWEDEFGTPEAVHDESGPIFGNYRDVTHEHP